MGEHLRIYRKITFAFKTTKSKFLKHLRSANDFDWSLTFTTLTNNPPGYSCGKLIRKKLANQIQNFISVLNFQQYYPHI